MIIEKIKIKRDLHPKRVKKKEKKKLKRKNPPMIVIVKLKKLHLNLQVLGDMLKSNSQRLQDVVEGEKRIYLMMNQQLQRSLKNQRIKPQNLLVVKEKVIIMTP